MTIATARRESVGGTITSPTVGLTGLPETVVRRDRAGARGDPGRHAGSAHGRGPGVRARTHRPGTPEDTEPPRPCIHPGAPLIDPRSTRVLPGATWMREGQPCRISTLVGLGRSHTVGRPTASAHTARGPEAAAGMTDDRQADTAVQDERAQTSVSATSTPPSCPPPTHDRGRRERRRPHRARDLPVPDHPSPSAAISPSPSSPRSHPTCGPAAATRAKKGAPDRDHLIESGFLDVRDAQRAGSTGACSSSRSRRRR